MSMENKSNKVITKMPILNRLSRFIDNNSNVLTIMIFSLLTSIMVLTLYIVFIAKRLERPIATVDVQLIMTDITAATFQKMNGVPADQQTKIAAENIKQSALKLEEAIHIVGQRHHAILMQKQALADTSRVTDYTNEVKNEIAKIK